MNPPPPYKQRILEYLQSVGLRGATNTQIREATQIPSHQQVYLLTQELLWERKIRSERKGNRWIFYSLDLLSPETFVGEWQIVSSPDFDRDYLFSETTPTIRITQNGLKLSGSFHIGLIRGELDGHVDGKRVLFSFEAMDELEPVHGIGTMTIRGTQMEFRLQYHFGDTWTFIFER